MMSKTLLLLLLVIFSQSLNAQKSFSLRVNDPRPLKEAIDELERQLGLPINYEDPVYLDPNDAIDITDQVQNAAQKARNPTVRIKIPKGGELFLESPISLVQPKMADLVSILVLLRQAHEGKGFAGRFEISQISSTISVEPVGSRDTTGQWKRSTSALNSPVTIPAIQRNAFETLTLLLDQVSKSISIRILIGGVPIGAITNSTIKFGATAEPAKSALVRLMEQLSRAPDGRLESRLPILPNAIRPWSQVLRLLDSTSGGAQ